MTINWTALLYGILGGLLAEVLKWWQLKESPTPPAYLKSGFYWGITGVMALVGGILALVYGVDASKPVLAINVGVSAPMILKGLASVIPAKPSAGTPFAGGPKRASLLDMVAGRTAKQAYGSEESNLLNS